MPKIFTGKMFFRLNIHCPTTRDSYRKYQAQLYRRGMVSFRLFFDRISRYGTRDIYWMFQLTDPKGLLRL